MVKTISIDYGNTKYLVIGIERVAREEQELEILDGKHKQKQT